MMTEVFIPPNKKKNMLMVFPHTMHLCVVYIGMQDPNYGTQPLNRERETH
jgi:hypothetical protein